MAARPRTAIAARAAGGAAARPIALSLASATGPALRAAFLRRRSILKDPWAAPGRASPPNGLTRGRFGRPRHLPLGAVTGVLRAAFARLLGPTAGLLRPAARLLLTTASGLLRPAARLLRPTASGLLSPGA